MLQFETLINTQSPKRKIKLQKINILTILCLFLAGCTSTQEYSKESANIELVNQESSTSKLKEDYKYEEIGVASYYGGKDKRNGKRTASGEKFDQNKMTAAHKTLPLASIVRVTNLSNGKSVDLKVNDRIHPRNKRVIDVSKQAAKSLGFHAAGLAQVKVQSVSTEMNPSKIIQIKHTNKPRKNKKKSKAKNKSKI